MAETKTKAEMKKELEQKIKEVFELKNKIKKMPQDEETTIDMFIHGDKEGAYDKAEEYELTSDQTENFVGALYEVKLTLSINKNEVKIIAVNDRKLMEEKHD